MSSFYNVSFAINSLERSKSTFDYKISMLNNVRSSLQNCWKTGRDRDEVLQVIQRIQDRCNEGKTLCQDAINEANAALQAAEQEERRREEEERRRREAERRRRLEEERRKREEEEKRRREEQERHCQG